MFLTGHCALEGHTEGDGLLPFLDAVAERAPAVEGVNGAGFDPTHLALDQSGEAVAERVAVKAGVGFGDESGFFHGAAQEVDPLWGEGGMVSALMKSCSGSDSAALSGGGGSEA